MSNERDLPEGVIDADPPGGWESADTADAETAEQNRDAEGSPELADDTASADRAVSVDDVQSDRPSRAADPDLNTVEES